MEVTELLRSLKRRRESRGEEESRRTRCRSKKFKVVAVEEVRLYVWAM